MVWSLLSVALCSLSLFVGCKKQQATSPTPSPTPPIKAVVQPSKPVIQTQLSSVKMAPAQTNQLDFSTKKDPFKPFVSVKASTPADIAKQKREMKPRLPIHSFDVSQFRLIGTVNDPKGNKAMVVDPGNKGYVLKVGMTIGKNEGKVLRIEQSGVDVLEQFRDDNNKIRKETIRIPLLRRP
jgi:type IV pilus assembly protein PilP